MIKLTILLKRNSSLSHEDFLWSFKNEHTKLFSSLPIVRSEVKHYDQFHSLPIAMPGLPEPEYDGIAELWFEDAESMFRVFLSDRYLETVRPVEKTLLDIKGCSILVSVHHKII